MPKMKTHKATAKRIKVTSSGKLLHRPAGNAHMLMKKSSRRKRRLAIMSQISGCDSIRLSKLISPGGQV
jgi:large subunit ribosomal protein L35